VCKTPHGKVFIVSGNRCLFALEAFADKLQEEGIQCVEVNTLLVSLTWTFPHVPLCPLCGSLYWVRKSGGGLRPVQPAVPRRPLSNAGLPVRCEAFETREGLCVCRVTVLPCHRWQHLLHCTRFCWWAPLAEMTSTVHPPSGTTASVLTPSLLGHISIDTGCLKADENRATPIPRDYHHFPTSNMVLVGYAKFSDTPIYRLQTSDIAASM